MPNKNEHGHVNGCGKQNHTVMTDWNSYAHPFSMYVSSGIGGSSVECRERDGEGRIENHNF